MTKRRTKKKTRWHFMKANRCPRCRGYNTIAYKTDGKVQYRLCRNPVCRERYHVIGIPEKKGKKTQKETKDGGQKTEDRRQKSEVRNQKTD